MTVTMLSNPQGIADRYEEVRRAITLEYRKRHSDPWIVAYSGGKDSTLLLQLVWETLLAIPAEERRRQVYVMANDTLVESPVVIRHLKKSMKAIAEAASDADLPISNTY